MNNIENQIIISTEQQSGTVVTFEPKKARFNPIRYYAISSDAIVEWNVPTPYGLRHCLVLTYDIHQSNQSGTTEINKLKQRYILSNYPKSKFGELYKELTGKTLGNSVDVSELVGKECFVKIAHNTNEAGDIFDNVEEVIRYKTDLTHGQF
ncbi:hypothetical protein [Niallia nealsonii]|uniref:Uncharacterized protein n=1 Tax=Niallia nealsonii TaxID=115979 RepID=A0A2N0Z443_9BACI|nr:hypothetical protein [Niallia nealsonii]PKG24276.1 hypothetical protein CWS01_07760 [Niallia nealsonii]